MGTAGDGDRPRFPQENVVCPLLSHVQCLRALAASAVVLLHAQMEAERFSSSAPFISSEIAEFGRYGIDLFFVISGFVIYYTNFPEALPARKFILRRALRIVPIYWTFTVLAFVLRVALPESAFVSPSPSGTDLFVSLTFLSGRQPMIGAGWTLEFEMFFYAAAALAIALSRPRWSLVVYALLALAVVGRFAAFELGQLSALMDPYLIEFAFGLVAAEIYCTGRLPALKLAAAAVAVLVTWTDHDSILWAGVPAALLVYGAAKFSSGRSERAATRICCALGDASYSIYLIQFFTLPVIARVIHAAFQGQTPNLIFFAGFLGTLLIGYVCYLYLERPLQRWGKGDRPRFP